MHLSQFHYDLPEDLIAQYPLTERVASRLLCVDGSTGQIEDSKFRELVNILHPGDLLVMNNTRVIPARLLGVKETGGKIEVLVERLLDNNRLLAQIRASKSPKAGTLLLLEQDVELEVLGRADDLFELKLRGQRTVIDMLEQCGHMPLPPYIKRSDEIIDHDRYQTVYAKEAGAVAAPTAGLHFDETMLDALRSKGIDTAEVTLHVGAGTFQPVRTDVIEDHRMHAEQVEVSDQVCSKIAATRAAGGRIVAVGTTAVRSLETAATGGELKPFCGESRLFCYPGFEFQVVDAMITNFHLPESTLLMLVTAFAGYEQVMSAYRHAVDQRYRFFSYGDAMFLTRAPVQSGGLIS